MVLELSLGNYNDTCETQRWRPQGMLADILTEIIYVGDQLRDCLDEKSKKIRKYINIIL